VHSTTGRQTATANYDRVWPCWVRRAGDEAAHRAQVQTGGTERKGMGIAQEQELCARATNASARGREPSSRCGGRAAHLLRGDARD
jgi:hypothetical protein